MHPDHLGKLFKSSYNKTISDYIADLRIDHTAKLLIETNNTIISIAFQAGFDSLRTFNRVFLKHMGVSPKIYRKDEILKHNKSSL